MKTLIIVKMAVEPTEESKGLDAGYMLYLLCTILNRAIWQDT